MLNVKTIYLSFVTVLFVAVPACLFLFGYRPRISHGPRITSYSNLYKIGVAIRDYASDNRELPKQLSNLVPRYVPMNQISIFYSVDPRVQNDSLPSDWTNPLQIDQFSSYVYLGTNNVDDILAYERTNLWKPNAPRAEEIAILRTNFEVQDIPVRQLCELFSGESKAKK